MILLLWSFVSIFIVDCVLPGTELAFAKPVEYATEGLLGWGRKTFDNRMAIFRQVNKERAAAHHDALEFPDGTVILLTRLLEVRRRWCFSCRHSPRLRPRQRRRSAWCTLAECRR